ncbi:SDR family NAD(P)-dependent oxidoreductase [Bifidobacterium vansinderenii]|uniref:3-oxoacyl-ACP reductase n=1 Tax=Bifidobacterium vansinderenii TaxID=1984871 RepID=A0A229W036_9BIFI|nr:SDR family NAD(P)-dependent oxidoreductase [Bifidobacterium vansinderenii]OXN01040.1 3-oxoacyl-ACP reductase [Bifidobacterium vansinderenii]
MAMTVRRWEDQTALVTGAGRGIGRATALMLASKGVRVAVNDINPDTARDTVEEIRRRGGEAVPAVGDVSDEADVTRIHDGLAADYGGADIVVNNAGVILSQPLQDVSVEQWDRILAVNLKGEFLNIVHAAPRMVEKGYGRIVNVSSIAAKHGGGFLGNVAYGSSKAGVASLTRGAAREYAPHGITVNAVMPGLTHTPMTDAMSDETRARIISGMLVKRAAEPEEIARVIVFLASPESGFITGETIDVDGGATLD